MATLTPKQIEVAQLLAGGMNITDTSKDAGVTRPTIYSWLKTNDDFLAYLNSLKAEQIDAVRIQLEALSTLAVDTLTAIMKNSADDRARISAAKEVLCMAGFNGKRTALFTAGITADEVAKNKRADAFLDSLSL